MSELKIEEIKNAIFQNKVKISVTTILAAILAWVFTLPIFVTPVYKSTTCIYPTNLLRYSIESTSEQLLEFLNSKELQKVIVKRFNLLAHYEVDTTNEKEVHVFYEDLNSIIQFRKTFSESILISVEDRSPALARDIANAVVEEVSNLIAKLKHEQYSEIVQHLTQQLNRANREINAIDSILKSLRLNYGVLDYKLQVKELSKKIATGKSDAEINKIIEQLKIHGGQNLIYDQLFYIQSYIIKEIAVELNKNLLLMDSKIKYAVQIYKATLSKKPIYPIPLLVIFICAISTFVISITYLVYKSK